MNAVGRHPEKAARVVVPPQPTASGIPLALDALGSALCRFDEVLAELANRIAPVLRPEPPAEVAGEKDSTPSTSTVAESVNGYTQHIARLVLRVEDLISRVDL